MLESLTIRNYAIIDELAVSFSGSLNVITGETGAGKSIVVDALELILGARASVEMIRQGSDALTVSAVFRVSPDGLFSDLSVSPDEENCLIIRREVRVDGSSRCYVNDVPVTVKVLKSLGDRLVDLHGQHDHQSLFDVPRHVSFLDAYGGTSPLAETVARFFRELEKLKQSISDRERKLEQMARNRELHKFQREEIAAAELKSGEDQSLGDDLVRLSRANDLKALGYELFETLSESEDSLAERVDALAGRVSQLARYDARLEQFMARMDELSLTVKDIAESFREYAEEIDDDPAALNRIEERLAVVERLKKKYGPALEEVFALFETLGRESNDSEEMARELETRKRKRSTLESELFDRAGELSEKRREAAPKLAQEAEHHLAQLGMAGARLIVDIQPAHSGERIEKNGRTVMIGPDGADRVELMFSANPGEAPRPLVKVASGGEISRLMLSLKLALINVVSVPTMIFDEIDIGVSGRVADSIGKKMRALSRTRQVLAITHLPQIAAMADRHFSARKSIRVGRTVTDLVPLDHESRQVELASLLSGDKLADTALAHAKELLEWVEHENGSEEKPEKK